jgi:hypothetical protein
VNISTNHEPGNELFPIREKKAVEDISTLGKIVSLKNRFSELSQLINLIV